MYDIVYSDKVVKQLEKLDREIHVRIITTLERLRIHPEAHDIKKLVGMLGFRFRVGDYRVIFDLEKEKLLILVLEIGHRRNIYD